MVFERTEHEPEEYDPEEDLHDPTESLTIPSVETSEADAPADIRAAFWLIVLTLNGAILATSLGLLVLIFRSDTTTGLVLLGGGIALFALAGRRYLASRSIFEGGATDDAAESTPDDQDPNADSTLESGNGPDVDADSTPVAEPDSDSNSETDHTNA